MRRNQTRASDATFDLNLAPVLDIIVSIVPMLLLSVAFVQVKMIEAPTPQLVNEQTADKNPPKPETQVVLRVSKKAGFVFEVTDPKGKTTKTAVDISAGQLNYEGLLASALKIKELYPDVSKLQLTPESDVPFEEIVKTMDQVRLKPRINQSAKLSISEATKAKAVENTDLFPDIVFSSIGG